MNTQARNKLILSVPNLTNMITADKLWMNFIKVVRMEGYKENEEDEECGSGDEFKTYLEWMPVSGTFPKFLSHLVDALEEYQAHMYKVMMIHHMKKWEEQCFFIKPAANRNCHE